MIDRYPNITKYDILKLFYIKNDSLYYRIKPSKNVSKDKKAGTKTRGYIKVQINGKQYHEHRIIYFLYYGNWPQAIDHVNQIKHDNRIENLRACTITQNTWNSKKSIKNTSGIKGVCWDKTTNKWKVQIWKNGIKYHIGVYSKIEDAKTAIEEVRLKMHGEFCHHG